jgi:uncharacterized ferritin-like protein (DUF455 family)
MSSTSGKTAHGERRRLAEVRRSLNAINLALDAAWRWRGLRPAACDPELPLQNSEAGRS